MAIVPCANIVLKPRLIIRYQTAKWDTKTKELQVVYNSDKISELQIHEIVASVGHDTDKVKAKMRFIPSFHFVAYTGSRS